MMKRAAAGEGEELTVVVVLVGASWFGPCRARHVHA